MSLDEQDFEAKTLGNKQVFWELYKEAPFPMMFLACLRFL